MPFFNYKYQTKRGALVKYKIHPHFQGGVRLPWGIFALCFIVSRSSCLTTTEILLNIGPVVACRSRKFSIFQQWCFFVFKQNNWWADENKLLKNGDSNCERPLPSGKERRELGNLTMRSQRKITLWYRFTYLKTDLWKDMEQRLLPLNF